MNTDQIASLVRSGMKALGVFLIAHGYTQTGNLMGNQEIAGYIVTGIGLLLSHWTHASTDSSNSTPSGTSKLSALIVCGALSATVFLSTGCASTPQQTAYRTVSTTAVTVDTAMNLWGAYVAANHPGTNAELAVENAYNKYQASMNVVIDAGQVYAANGTNTTAAASFDQALANSSQELTDLENLITSFGVKLN